MKFSRMRSVEREGQAPGNGVPPTHSQDQPLALVRAMYYLLRSNTMTNSNFDPMALTNEASTATHTNTTLKSLAGETWDTAKGFSQASLDFVSLAMGMAVGGANAIPMVLQAIKGLGIGVYSELTQTELVELYSTIEWFEGLDQVGKKKYVGLVASALPGKITGLFSDPAEALTPENAEAIKEVIKEATAK